MMQKYVKTTKVKAHPSVCDTWEYNYEYNYEQEWDPRPDLLKFQADHLHTLLMDDDGDE